MISLWKHQHEILILFLLCTFCLNYVFVSLFDENQLSPLSFKAYWGQKWLLFIYPMPGRDQRPNKYAINSFWNHWMNIMDVGIWGGLLSYRTCIIIYRPIYIPWDRVLTLSQGKKINLNSQESYSAPLNPFNALHLFEITQWEHVSPMLALKKVLNRTMK